MAGGRLRRACPGASTAVDDRDRGGTNRFTRFRTAADIPTRRASSDVLMPAFASAPGLGHALMLGVTPFLVGDALTILLASLLLPAVWRLALPTDTE